MRIYLAGGECKQWLGAIGESDAERALFSYFYFIQAGATFRKQALSTGLDIFVDSGGFSAKTQGHKISVEDYGRWLQEIKGQVSAYANLDKIGNWRGTQKNQRRLEAMGLDPIPVFHVGSPFGHLKELVAEYDYIALGGMVPLKTQNDKLHRWLSSCFSIIRDEARVHGFGLTSLPLMKTFPFYSVDSTSWLVGTKFGKVMHFEKGGLKTFSQGKQRARTVKERRLQDQDDKRYYERVVHNANEWKKAEDYLTEYWKKRGITWTP